MTKQHAQKVASWRAFDKTLGEVRKKFADMNPDELEALIKEAVDAATPCPRPSVMAPRHTEPGDIA